MSINNYNYYKQQMFGNLLWNSSISARNSFGMKLYNPFTNKRARKLSQGQREYMDCCRLFSHRRAGFPPIQYSWIL